MKRRVLKRHLTREARWWHRHLSRLRGAHFRWSLVATEPSVADMLDVEPVRLRQWVLQNIAVWDR